MSTRPRKCKGHVIRRAHNDRHSGLLRFESDALSLFTSKGREPCACATIDLRSSLRSAHGRTSPPVEHRIVCPPPVDVVPAVAEGYVLVRSDRLYARSAANCARSLSNSSGAVGFVRWLSKPASDVWRRSTSCPQPVSA